MKRAKPPAAAQHVLARALEQVEGGGWPAGTVRLDVLPALLGQHGLHRGLRAHRHEGRRANIAVGRVNDAGAAVSGTVSPKPAGRGWQAGDRFEMEGAAVAGLSGLCAQRMFKKADRHMFTLGRRARKGPEIVKNSVSRGGFRRSTTIYFRFKGLPVK